MKTLSCADLGSKYCPCHLAYSKDCIGCNMLNKNEICDCIWQGVCVYNEVNHNKKFSVVAYYASTCVFGWLDLGEGAKCRLRNQNKGDG